MNKKIILLFAVVPMLLGACKEITSESTSSNNDEYHTVTYYVFEDDVLTKMVKDGECADKFIPAKIEGYNFINWFTGPNENDEIYDFDLPVTADLSIYAHWLLEEADVTTDTLVAALNNDYTNSTIYMYQSGMQDEFIVSNYDGYNVAETAYDGIGIADYLYFHDYEGLSHQYFYDSEHGGAWLRQGIKFQDGSYALYDINRIYFSPMVSFPIIAENAQSFTYIGGNAFSLVDQNIIDGMLADGLYESVWLNDIAMIIVFLDEAKEYVTELRTFDSLDENDEAYTTVQVSNIGTTELIGATLPEAPTEETVMTYYEWQGEEEPIYTEITAIALDYVDPNITSVNLDKTLELKYTLTPENPGRKDLEFLFEGTEEGIEINYSFTAGQIVVKGLIAGEYMVQIHDIISDTYSNKVKVVVNDVVESQFTNKLYDLKLKKENDAFVLANSLENGYVATYQGAQLGFGVDYVTSGDNPKLNALTIGMKMDVNSQETMQVEGIDHVYVDFVLDHPVNALTFTYGAIFENQVANAQTSAYYDAHIYSSLDGESWNLESTWTDELAENITAKGLMRKDQKLSVETQHIRIAFQSKFIGKGFTFVMNTFGFFLEN